MDDNNTLPSDVFPLSQHGPEVTRSPHTNQYLTKGMFVENREGAFLSFRSREHDPENKVFSLYRLYMDIADPAEHEFAVLVFGDWEHWQALCNSHFFREGYLSKWREELKAKLISDLHNRLVEDALSTSSRSAASSAKYLLDKLEGGKEKKAAGPGRPKTNTTDKDPIPKFSSSVFSEDFDRIKNHKAN